MTFISSENKTNYFSMNRIVSWKSQFIENVYLPWWCIDPFIWCVRIPLIYDLNDGDGSSDKRLLNQI